MWHIKENINKGSNKKDILDILRSSVLTDVLLRSRELVPEQTRDEWNRGRENETTDSSSWAQTDQQKYNKHIR
jgi:hypothetical protein